MMSAGNQMFKSDDTTHKGLVRHPEQFEHFNKYWIANVKSTVRTMNYEHMRILILNVCKPKQVCIACSIYFTTSQI